MPFLMHGEEVGPDIDVFDREAVFIERRLVPWTREFPGLKFVLEHVSSKIGVDYVRSAAPQVAATMTPYHLVLNRTDWLGYGLKPYMYCMPVIKTEQDRLTVLSPILLPLAFAPVLDLANALAGAASGDALTVAPPELSSSWQFAFRTAAPPRAPSFAS